MWYAQYRCVAHAKLSVDQIQMTPRETQSNRWMLNAQLAHHQENDVFRNGHGTACCEWNQLDIVWLLMMRRPSSVTFTCLLWPACPVNLSADLTKFSIPHFIICSIWGRRIGESDIAIHGVTYVQCPQVTRVCCLYIYAQFSPSSYRVVIDYILY